MADLMKQIYNIVDREMTRLEAVCDDVGRLESAQERVIEYVTQTHMTIEEAFQAVIQEEQRHIAEQ